jgi:TRAP-type mannitol/chloroaromatic compound transport system permease small subunit
MKGLRYYIRFIDSLNERIGHIVSWLTTVLVIVVCYDVFTRYLLRKTSIAVQELEWHLFAVVFLIGSAYTLRHDRHVRVDVLYGRLNERQRAWINLIGGVIFLIPFCLLVIYTSSDFVINSFLIRETSPDPGGLPARYILKACIPAGFILLLLQGLSMIFRSVLILKGEGIER